MIFDMVVQMLDSSKDTIAWSGRHIVSLFLGKNLQIKPLPSDFIVPSAYSNLFLVFRSLVLACFGLDGRRRAGGDWLTSRGELR